MSKIEDGGPAFPHDGGIATGGEPIRESEGMSLRMYLVAHAPAMPPEFEEAALNAARIAGNSGPDEWQGIYLYLRAKWAIRYADNVLKALRIEREKGGGQ